MEIISKRALPLLLATAALVGSNGVFAHGNVTPQAVDVTGLEPLGEAWKEENPYVGNEAAIKIGAAAYNANCARCHGLEAVSGGIAPDLRELPNGKEGDEFYMMRARGGAIRNGVTYMPKFEGILQQEAMWAIRAWLQSISVETVEAAPAKPADAAAPATDAKPADAAAPAEAPATDAKPADAATPAAAPAADAKPADAAAPAEAPAADAKPADASAPAEAPATDAKPADAAAPAADAKPAEAAAAPATDAKPAEEIKPTAEPAEKKSELKSELKTESTSSAAALDPDSQMAKIIKKGVLEVAVYKDFPPYSYTDGGNSKGIDVDIAHALAKKLNLTASIRMVGADENVEDDLRNNVWKGHYIGGGVADVMLHMPVDRQFSEMVDQVSFVSPYQVEKLVFAFDTSKVGPEPTIASFTSKPIGVELDTLSDFYLIRALGGKITPNVKHFRSVSDAVAALKAGEVAGVMGPRGEVQGNLKDKPANIVVQRLVTPGLSRGDWALGVAVKAKNEDVTAAVNKAMGELVVDGTIKQIFTDYGVDYEQPAEPLAKAE